MTTYADFLQRKQRVFHGAGIATSELPSQLYPWQAAITRWALKKGRCALFEDCGLGKTLQQIAWAQALKTRTLILAPLCVAEQTVAEAQKIGATVRYCASQSDVSSARDSLSITNYERLEKFDPSVFGAVVLDESSILKAFDGKTRTRLIQAFKDTPYRLCCTATPSPNDIAELANHAEFLGLMTRAEFLATWFVHDDAGWRMKKHAVEPFYRWLASWAIALRKPSDLGYPDEGFALPPLTIHEHIVESTGSSSSLFPELGLSGIHGRMAARRDSLTARLDETAALVSQTPDQWIIWCGLNDEAERLSEMLSDSVNVQGSDTYAEKRGAVEAFLAGKIQHLVSKIRILGYGMNFQNCHNQAFCGIGDSFEMYYQAIRRSWRFGQTKPVHAHVIVSDAERAVVENVRRKEQRYADLADGLLRHMRDFEREELAS